MPQVRGYRREGETEGETEMTSYKFECLLGGSAYGCRKDTYEKAEG